MPDSSKGCECNAKYCVPCFVQDFRTRVKPIELMPNTTGATNERGLIGWTIDTHWESGEQLMLYLIRKFQDFLELFDEDFDREEDPGEENRALFDCYVKQRMKYGRDCPFCRRVGVWNMGDEPHLENGRLQLTRPYMTFAPPVSVSEIQTAR